MTVSKAKLQAADAITCQRLSLTDAAARDGILEVEVDKTGTDGSELGAAVAEVVEPPWLVPSAVVLETTVADGMIAVGCPPADAPFLQFLYDQSRI